LLCLPYAQLTQLRSCTLGGFLLQAEPAATAAGNSHSSKAGKASSTYNQGPGSSKHGSSSSRHPLCHLSSLTELTLYRIKFDCFTEGLRSLSALKALQNLTIGNGVKVASDDMQQQQQRGTRSAGKLQKYAQDAAAKLLCLQQLTQLTRLELDPCYFPVAAAVAPLSSLQQLQYLELHSTLRPKQAPGLLAKLPASLTHLQFAWEGKQPLDFDTAPAIAGLTALRTLIIFRWGGDQVTKRGGLDPLLLSNMQQLQMLKLDWLSSDALPALLQVMPRLTSLQLLELECGAVEALPASEAAR
jgi:hypothetical protein